MFETQKETVRFGPTASGWALIASSILSSPLILAIVLVTAMERDYTYVSLFFQIPYLIRVLSVADPAQLAMPENMHVGPLLMGMAAVFALLQFPVYAVIFAVTKRREAVIPALAVAHFLLAIAAYLTFIFTGS